MNRLKIEIGVESSLGYYGTIKEIKWKAQRSHGLGLEQVRFYHLWHHGY